MAIQSKLISLRKDIKWSNKLAGAGNPNFKDGQYVDDKGYIRVLAPNHPHKNRGYIYMHRLVAERHLGRYLESWEVIHHINEIKLDNRWDNFFLTTTKEHTILHREGKTQSMETAFKRRKTVRVKRKKGTLRKRNANGQFG